MLNVIFSGVLFTPGGDLLYQFQRGSHAHALRTVRGTGGQPRLNGSWRPLRTRWGISTSPARVKREKILKIQHGRESGDTGRSANAGLFQAPGCGIGRGPAKMARQC